MGDPAGIGPEIAAKALAVRKVRDLCRPLIIGDARTMEKAAALTGVDLAVHPVSRVAEALFVSGTMDVYDLRDVDLQALEYGKVSPMAGAAAFEAVKKAIELAQAGL